MQTSTIINSVNEDLKNSSYKYSCKQVSWDDVSRSVTNSHLSCWGPNITDTRLVSKDSKRLYTVRSDNWNEKLGSVSAEEIALIVKNPETGSMNPVTLKDYLQNIGKYGSYAGISKDHPGLYSEELDSKVSIRFQTTFLPVKKNGDFNSVEFCPETYNYNTKSAKDPRNLLVLGTTQGTSLQQDASGFQKLFNHAVDKDGKIHRYWFEAEQTNKDVDDNQEETKEEAEKAVSRGKATSSVIGIESMGVRMNVLMSIQIPMKQQEPSISRSSYTQAMFNMPFGGTPTYTAYGGLVSYGGHSSGCSSGFDSSMQMKNNSVHLESNCYSVDSVSGGFGSSGFGSSGGYGSGGLKKSKHKKGGSSSKRLDRLRMERSVPLRGLTSVARVSRGTEQDIWSGLTVKEPERDPNQHITVTVVVYYTVEGGVPRSEDVRKAVDDLDFLYGECEWSGNLADKGASFMHSNNVSKKPSNPYVPPVQGLVQGHSTFPLSVPVPVPSYPVVVDNPVIIDGWTELRENDCILNEEEIAY